MLAHDDVDLILMIATAGATRRSAQWRGGGRRGVNVGGVLVCMADIPFVSGSASETPARCCPLPFGARGDSMWLTAIIYNTLSSVPRPCTSPTHAALPHLLR